MREAETDVQSGRPRCSDPDPGGRGADAPDPTALEDACVELALAAGHRTLEAFEAGETEPVMKADGSPVTQADLDADRIIASGLREAFPHVPVVSEEAHESHRRIQGTFFLVDPLDGTWQFLRGLPEFTVNIACIERSRPAFGAMFAPALGRLFHSRGPHAAVSCHVDRSGRRSRSLNLGPGRRRPHRPPRIVVSRSMRHNRKLPGFVRDHGAKECTYCSSSLKFGLLAAGEAEIYPRYSSINEWDVAAGHAILRASGGDVVSLDGGKSLSYGNPGRPLPPFVAFADGMRE